MDTEGREERRTQVRTRRHHQKAVLGVVFRARHPTRAGLRRAADALWKQDWDFGTRGRPRHQISLSEKARAVCVNWATPCQQRVEHAQDGKAATAAGEQDGPSRRRGCTRLPGRRPAASAAGTVFTLLSSKFPTWESKSELFRRSGKVNKTEKETMSDRTTWLLFCRARTRCSNLETAASCRKATSCDFEKLWKEDEKFASSGKGQMLSEGKEND